MPQVRKPKIETEGIDPKELQKLERAVLSGSEAPTTAQQTPEAQDWDRFRDSPGPPFDAERLTLAQMRQIRKHPMIAFGLHYRKVPIARSEWHIQARDKNGPNAQVAGFVDASLREIFSSYILQRMLVLDFGFQTLVKQWKFANPGGVYIDSVDIDDLGNPKVKPVWDEGNVLPKVWKHFVGLLPEHVHPRFVEKGTNAGSFDGIDYDVPQGQRARSGGFAAVGGAKAKKGIIEISVYNSLWATHQKWDEHGSLYGFPLTGYAADHWWDSIFIAGLRRRAFERIAIPPIKAHHPDGSTVIDEETGEKRMNWEIALDMAERMRSNAIAAIPSTMAETGVGEVSGSKRAWDFEYMETPTDVIDVFDKALSYQNIMLLRSIWVPEQAFIGKESGNSGGNIADVMQNTFTASQELLMSEIIGEIGQFMIPDLLWLNFPEFVNNGGKAWVVSHGFRNEDLELYRQVIQLLGQAADTPKSLEDVDTRELLRRAGLPLKDPAVLAAERDALAKQISTIPQVAPVAGQVGTVANPNVNQGFTNGGSVPQPATAGFGEEFQQPYIYMSLPDPIELDFADVDEFLSGLPNSKHYTDKSVRALSVQIRKLWLSHFRRLYPEFARYLNKLKTVELEDDLLYDEGGVIELADRKKVRVTFVSKTQAEKVAKKIIKGFGDNSKELEKLHQRSADLIRRILDRAVKNEMKNSRIDSEIDADSIRDFVEEQSARLIKLTHETFRSEVSNHLINEIREGKKPSEIATEFVSRFETAPNSKANKVARSETRDAVNAATLISSEGAGIRYVRARDAQLGNTDKDCEERDGKLFTVKEAWKQLRSEHTYGTLGFEPIPRANFSIEWIDKPDDAEEDSDWKAAYFDDDTSTAYLARNLDDETADEFLFNVSEYILNHSNGNGKVADPV